MRKRYIYTLFVPIACAMALFGDQTFGDQSFEDQKNTQQRGKWSSYPVEQTAKTSKSLYSYSCLGNSEDPAFEPQGYYPNIETTYVDDAGDSAMPTKGHIAQELNPGQYQGQYPESEAIQGNAQVPSNAQSQNSLQDSVLEAQSAQKAQTLFKGPAEGPVINFNNVSITEYLRFVSRLTGKNFVFDPQELQFPVTIISETPATLEDVMAALQQNLRIHNFYLIEEGNSFVIYSNSAVKAPAGLLYIDETGQARPDVATQVFHVTNVSPGSVASVVRSMVTKDAVVEVIEETNNIVVTDILANVKKIDELLKKLDSPASGLEIGQYVAINNSPAALISVASRIVTPLAGDKQFILVPYQTSNSVFVVSTPFLVEKALSVMQALDLNIGVSGLLNVDQLKFDAEAAKKLAEEKANELLKEKQKTVPLSQEEVDILTERERFAILQSKGFSPEQLAKLSAQQISRILREKGLSQAEREKILGQRRGLFESELPLGQIESTQFLIYKLQYRKADTITKALQAIAVSLQGSETIGKNVQVQSDIVVTLNSVQPLDENNSIVFTGTRATLQKVKDLLSQVDVPVRQVFIEVLILDTNLNESLNFGVEWGVQLQRKNFAGQLGLITNTNPNPVSTALTGITFPPDPNTVPPTVLTPPGLAEGFTATQIGRKVKFNGKGLLSSAALINLLRSDTNTEIILNPKIVTEHNVAAELFVGSQVPIKGQSIVNATGGAIGNTVATNYNIQQVGVSLKVTPLISSSDTVTLIIEQKISNANQAQVNSQGLNNAPPATVNEISATTRVHMPSGYFLCMSGLLSTQNGQQTTRFPILGQLPLIGFFFSNDVDTVQKRNVIMYLRPKIIDTPIDIETITKIENGKFDEACSTTKGVKGALTDLKKILHF
jgi:type III secretion protein C